MTGDLLTIDQVRVMFGSPGKPVGRKAVYTWVRSGVTVRGRSEHRIRLRCQPTPAGMRFTAEDVGAFLRAMRIAHEMSASREARRDTPALPEKQIGTYPPLRGGGRRLPRHGEPPRAVSRRLRLAPSAGTDAG